MKILFVTDKYYPKPLANAVCVQSVIDCLTEQGVKVDVLAFKDSGVDLPKSYHDARVEGIVPSIEFRLSYYGRSGHHRTLRKAASVAGSVLSKFKKVIYLPWFPMNSLIFPYRLKNRISRLYEENCYDAVVTAMAPFDGAMAGFLFSKEHPETNWIVYALDTIENMSFPFLPRNLVEGRFWFSRFVKRSDLCIVMRSRMDWYKSRGYCTMAKNLQVSDIPLLIKKRDVVTAESYDFGDGDEHWVYAGSLNPPHYRYDDLIRYFKSLPQNKKRVLHFYSGGNGFEALKAIADVSGGAIRCRDYVPHGELERILMTADVLVSMKYSDQISAKIFEYMSYGKPVLHVSGTDNDPDIRYISRYGRGLVLHSEDPDSLNEDKLVTWIGRGCHADNGSDNRPIEEILVENTPEHTCRMILDFIKIASKGHIS